MSSTYTRVFSRKAQSLIPEQAQSSKQMSPVPGLAERIPASVWLSASLLHKLRFYGFGHNSEQPRVEFENVFRSRNNELEWIVIHPFIFYCKREFFLFARNEFCCIILPIKTNWSWIKRTSLEKFRYNIEQSLKSSRKLFNLKQPSSNQSRRRLTLG